MLEYFKEQGSVQFISFSINVLLEYLLISIPYAYDILQETGLLNAKSVNIPMNPKIKFINHY